MLPLARWQQLSQAWRTIRPSQQCVLRSVLLVERRWGSLRDVLRQKCTVKVIISDVTWRFDPQGNPGKFWNRVQAWHRHWHRHQFAASNRSNSNFLDTKLIRSLHKLWTKPQQRQKLWERFAKASAAQDFRWMLLPQKLQESFRCFVFVKFFVSLIPASWCHVHLTCVCNKMRGSVIIEKDGLWKRLNIKLRELNLIIGLIRSKYRGKCRKSVMGFCMKRGNLHMQ